MIFTFKYNYKNEKLVIKDGTVHTEHGVKLFCKNCTFPFRKEHVAKFDKDGNPLLYHDTEGHVYCPLCAKHIKNLTTEN